MHCYCKHTQAKSIQAVYKEKLEEGKRKRNTLSQQVATLATAFLTAKKKAKEAKVRAV